MEAKQYFGGEWRPLKAELSGHYVRRKGDVTFPRSEEQIDARLRELLAQGNEAGGSLVTGGASKPRVPSELN
jgi:hypothetical protein